MKMVHEFAIYIDQFSSLISSVALEGNLVVDDQDVYHRITRVLRLHKNESCVLFDRFMHGSFLIKDFQGKTRIIGTLMSKKVNHILSPEIVFILPLLKREDLDLALYSLVEVGVNRIQLVITEKVQRSWRGEKEHDRLQRVMIAAAEQSKNFVFPDLLLPVAFDHVIEKMKGQESSFIFFAPDGDSLHDVIHVLEKQQTKKITLMVGPEGDLTSIEKSALKKNGVHFCALTPTILRAWQAAALGSGVFRSMI